MDQQRIGSFLKTLRMEQGLTQEQLAEKLGVSNRSVSRWENGRNMPDFDLLMELARSFGVGIDELLDGERKPQPTSRETEQVLMKAVDYRSDETLVYSRRLGVVFFAGAATLLGYRVIDQLGLTGGWEHAADFMQGISQGILLSGGLYACKFMAKVRALKRKLLRRSGK